jgi:hypothetical protein
MKAAMTLVATLATAVSGFELGRTNNTISSSGGNRNFLMYVPANLTLPAPVMFNFHGFNNNEDCTMNNFGMQQLADLNKFIAVTPRGSGFPLGWNGGDCCGLARNNDVQFFRDMVTEISSMGDLDMNRFPSFLLAYLPAHILSFPHACLLACLSSSLPSVSFGSFLIAFFLSFFMLPRPPPPFPPPPPLVIESTPGVTPTGATCLTGLRARPAI